MNKINELRDHIICKINENVNQILLFATQEGKDKLLSCCKEPISVLDKNMNELRKVPKRSGYDVYEIKKIHPAELIDIYIKSLERRVESAEKALGWNTTVVRVMSDALLSEQLEKKGDIVMKFIALNETSKAYIDMLQEEIDALKAKRETKEAAEQ